MNNYRKKYNMENQLNIEAKRDRRVWSKRQYLIPPMFLAGAIVIGFVVMLLWNAILPDVLGVKIITFWQALGLLLLSKILFGGYHNHHVRHKPHHNDKRREFWRNLSSEEKIKMRNELWNKFKQTSDHDSHSN
jgi:Ca2+/H+ antiporter, TMEM165/GDT1 family